jgi:drug/metabolite transporter (DMT)-like permease
VTGEAPLPMSRRAAQVTLQVTVLLWGFTAILGKLISISAIPLVWYRLAITTVVTAGVVAARGIPFAITARDARRYLGVGALIALHWMCFYGSIKQAGVATGVLTLSTITFFTAVFEPIVFRRRVATAQLVLGAFVVVGVSLLIKLELRADALGIALGLGSAVLSAAFGTLNGKYAHGVRAELLLFYEMAAALAVTTAVLALWPAQAIAPWHLAWADLGWLAVLGVMCTVVPQLWALRVLRVLSPFTVALSVNLEPVYSLIIAAILWTDAEPLSVRFYGGAALLIFLVVINGLRKAAASAGPPRDIRSE